MSTSVPIILASQSPQRVALLREAGIAFEAVSPKFDEPPVDAWHDDPAGFAEAASLGKAESLAADYPDRVILGADTVVAIGNHMFGKPADVDDARRILSTLMGARQQVITGVTLLHPASACRITTNDVTHITMRPMLNDELEAYLASGEWQGKAGAYGIQGTADRFVAKLEGSYSNVVGLPIDLVQRLLAGFGA